jgi:hypothetical protein
VGDFLKEVINRLYPWTIHVIGLIVVVALGVFFWYSFWGVHRFTNAFAKILSRDDRIKELQQKSDEWRELLLQSEQVASQLSSVVFNVTPLIDALNSIRVLGSAEQKIFESMNLVQRVLDCLTNDIKSKAGGNHRCAVWMIEGGNVLKPFFASAGFPKHYVNQRTLDLDRTIAGKCYRKRQSIHIDDVTKDSDWLPNPESRTPYKSLICIPLGKWGVLTIDGFHPMPSICVNIGCLYGAVIEGCIIEHFEAFSLRDEDGVDIPAEVG